jgi:hypothetical protein
MFNAVDTSLQAKDQEKQANASEIRGLRSKLADLTAERTAYALMMEVKPAKIRKLTSHRQSDGEAIARLIAFMLK